MIIRRKREVDMVNFTTTRPPLVVNNLEISLVIYAFESREVFFLYLNERIKPLIRTNPENICVITYYSN